MINEYSHTGFSFYSANNSYIIGLRNGASYYTWLGSPSSSNPFSIAINGVGGFPYTIYNTNNSLSGMIHAYEGRVGIGVSSPSFPLHITSTTSSGNTGFYAARIDSYGNTYGRISTSNDSISLKCGPIWCLSYVWISSDSRIKKNIIDVPDNLALEQLRNIPCRYYEYIDKIDRGNNKTIGFIAQEVKAILPMAVSQRKEIIPNIYKVINSTWTSVDDKFIMSSTDLTNVNGIKYKFYVSNDTDASDETEIEITGNSDNTFTFDMQYTNVFCYGKEIDDFNILDKQKLYTLNFSATQEIDRIQQTHITKIASLETENATLNTKVTTLETENATLKAIIDKLTTATSFDDFKSKL